MKKFFAAVMKILTVLTVLGALACAVVLYWDKLLELAERVKSLVSEKKACCCHREQDDYADYADWDE